LVGDVIRPSRPPIGEGCRIDLVVACVHASGAPSASIQGWSLLFHVYIARNL
jgi:hypothetical protein